MKQVRQHGNWMLWVALLTLLLVACQGQPVPDTVSQSPGGELTANATDVPATPQAPEATLSDPTIAPSATAAGGSEPDADGPPAPEPTGVVFVPSDRTGFNPTDPGTVNLASGQLQLVEFFAFW